VTARPVAQTTVLCASALIALALVVAGITSMQSKAAVAVVVAGTILIAMGILVGGWQLGAARKARVAVTGGQEYRGLADEYRRLSDLAVTAQEHTDLKLGDITVQLAQLRDQLESVQRILKDVE
jgi:hypothetical protein